MIIAPSILSADFSRLGQQVAECEAAGAAWFHIDVMDGQFVPNISFGPVVVAALRRVTRLPLDVHLMIVQPERYLRQFAEAGADHLTVHMEACPDPRGTLAQVRALGKRAGLAFNPQTPVTAVEPYLVEVDLILPMSVHPGFSGQKFIPETLPKIQQLHAAIEAQGLKTIIEVDGGIDTVTGPQARAAGATAFVAASAIFKHAGGIAGGLAALRTALAD